MRGIADYRIVESAGATEGAPAAGTAEVIVDITTTGATLAANGLKMLDDGVILKSQAQLAASLTADWDANARAAAQSLLARLGARERAKASHMLRVHLDKNADAILKALASLGVTVLSRPSSVAGEYRAALSARPADGCDRDPARAGKRRDGPRCGLRLRRRRHAQRQADGRACYCGEAGPALMSGSFRCSFFHSIIMWMRLRPEG